MNNSNINLLTLRDLIKKLALSRSTIYRKLKPTAKGYDPTFPKPKKIGPGSVRWVLSEVEQWIIQQTSKNYDRDEFEHLHL
ncbi:AlpA family transcriptional regulator [Thiomicrospira sp. ALE5]|uniref:helix-turn-helix transcriptional regulator n=1 Tax=Thiomicrospira sp. ALE5 TaxID=748650 RepID=UPI0008E9F518|nr:AlpA family transcriptional regulator [Thiomicrospira sp. ALE5]SFR52704.1 transcriptional regulator, AlpA family [Thiomicrospira sp. ALE5]